MRDPFTTRWNSISLRTKITGVTVLLVTLGLLVAGLGTMTVLRNYLLSEVDTRISDAANSLDSLDSTCATKGPVDYFIAVVDAGGKLICQNKQSLPSPLVASMTTSDVSGTRAKPFTLWDANHSTQWRVVAVPRTDSITKSTVALVVGLSLKEANATVNSFTGIFFGFGISVVVLGAALTRLIVTSTFGPLRQVEATAAAIADGNFGERLPGATPNTEVGRLNRSLNTMLARIDHAFSERAKTIEQMRRFVGDASHELRTPLVSVRGYAELYRMGAITSKEDVCQAMERIEKEAIRMGELVEDLLELARIDEAKPLQLKPVDLVPIVYDAALDTMASAPDRTVNVIVPEAVEEQQPTGELVSSAAGKQVQSSARGFAGTQLARLRALRWRGIEVAAGTSTVVENTGVARRSGSLRNSDIRTVVLAEENKIRQVVTNLLGNAQRFTDSGSPIELAVRVDEERRVAMIDVIDHGDGLPLQIRERIFERFWRADSSRTRETGGSGLGLAIVAGIVSAHHGTVEVLETAGGGATFRVILPLLPAQI